MNSLQVFPLYAILVCFLSNSFGSVFSSDASHRIRVIFGAQLYQCKAKASPYTYYYTCRRSDHPYLYAGKFDTSYRRGKAIVDGNTVYVTVDNFAKYANAKGFFLL